MMLSTKAGKPAERQRKMKTQKSETAVRYLRAAATAVDTYGEADQIGMLVAEIYGAAAYNEGDIMEIAMRLVSAREKAIQEGT
jgi:hypothetical protein